jgi:hypothetical protein
VVGGNRNEFSFDHVLENKNKGNSSRADFAAKLAEIGALLAEIGGAVKDEGIVYEVRLEKKMEIAAGSNPDFLTAEEQKFLRSNSTVV